ncbi:hypothetical protein MYCTH_2121768 [Thermothelomyces thermophilus ATCC 42464]|uniref:Uncharacterized protein n=1 Tax=Thermothelomyces thermophilus (strain ATCC 42464 / BCRC 31852 / DSM 1799) TaxID=573729 RepID=G2QNE1_THET4|nr:uncharacterized protein MYCTH_2121768 [Thermothelomyces thermophilus ATCC 42464]AEO62014.1 hypothetical protein MYCTH_2121768 [Thermothelomyces thermophilus ATCC 42464]
MAKQIMRLSVRSRYRLILLGLVTLIIWYSLLPDEYISESSAQYPWSVPDPDGNAAAVEMYEWDPLAAWEKPDAVLREKAYRPAPKPAAPVPDPFPLLSQNPPPAPRLLRAPEINRPPRRHYAEQTPLFVGFTRNWPQLLQCVVSYIAAGWPPEDIQVVENTGVMYANQEGRLTLQNPFYLNHTQLRMLGVNIIITPTLLTFSQLQNFYLRTALDLAFPYYFWTHQDVLVFSHENLTDAHGNRGPSLYTNAVRTLRHLISSSSSSSTTGSSSSSSSDDDNDKDGGRIRRPWAWAHHFFAYDHLALVHRDAVLAAGGWDAHIPFYASDCDAYLRLWWAGYAQTEGGVGVPGGPGEEVGLVLDVGSVMEDVGALLRIPGSRARMPRVPGEEEDANDDNNDDDDDQKEEENLWGRGRDRDRDRDRDYFESWERLVALGEKMRAAKYAGGNAGRNTWQARQKGGQGEPFYRDPDGFEAGVGMLIDLGRAVFAEKWGHRGCDVARMGVTGEDAWRLERDWDEETEGRGFEGGSW